MSTIFPIIVALIFAVLGGGIGYYLALNVLNQAAERDQRILDTQARWERATTSLESARETYERMSKGAR